MVATLISLEFECCRSGVSVSVVYCVPEVVSAYSA